MKKPIKPWKTEADKLSSIVWSRAVKIASGGMSRANLEVEFMPNCVERVGGQLVRPHLIDRYATGLLTPKLGKQKCGGSDLVFRIEAKFEGTARWLFHPLWSLMQPKEYTLNELHTCMADLNGLFFNKFFSNNEALIRNYFAEPSDVRKIAEEDKTLDAFAFLLGILREAEIRADMQNHNCARVGMRTLLPYIAAIPQMEPVIGRLFDYIENTYFNVIYTIPPYGVEMSFQNSWRETYPDISLLYPIETVSNISNKDRRYILKPV